MPRLACLFLLLVSSGSGCSNQASAGSREAELETSPRRLSEPRVSRPDSEAIVLCTSQLCSGKESRGTVLVAWDGDSEFLGGARVQVSTGADLQAVIARQRLRSEPLTIVIQNTISSDNSPPWIDVRDVTNVSIVGAGAGVEFNGIGMRLTRANNVVLRRLHVPFVQIGEQDGISLEGHVDHAWIDHSEMSDDHEDVGKQYHGTLVSPHDEGVPLLAEPDPARTSLPGTRASGVQRPAGTQG